MILAIYIPSLLTARITCPVLSMDVNALLVFSWITREVAFFICKWSNNTWKLLTYLYSYIIPVGIFSGQITCMSLSVYTVSLSRQGSVSLPYRCRMMAVTFTVTAWNPSPGLISQLQSWSVPGMAPGEFSLTMYTWVDSSLSALQNGTCRNASVGNAGK